jgi:hypothetical protein
MMHTIHREQVLPRPRDEVFPFFAAARNLERITPAFLRFRVLTPEPIILRPGSRIDYTLRLAGVPFHWRTRIEAFDPPLSFVDVQEKGPYRHWRHRHEFREVPGGTLMVDDVEYEVGWGVLGQLAHAIFVRRALERIFDHRRQVIAGILGA